MLREESVTVKSWEFATGRVRDYAQLLKPNLSFLVVFSSVIGYLLAPNVAFNWEAVGALFAAGILVTGSANTINQIIERRTDALMKRTMTRPLPDGRMGITEACLVATIAGALGIWVMGVAFNPIASVLSFTSLLLYAFAYTPMKRIHPVAVLIGAIPGALPPLIGWVAATGSLDMGGWVLFLFQFFWQFPHFWAIAWVGFEDYEKAGIRMLPSKAGKTHFTGLQCMIYSFVLFPLAVVPRLMNMTGNWGMFISMLAALYYFNASIDFYRQNDKATARKVMYASFIYLPLVLLALLFDKM